MNPQRSAPPQIARWTIVLCSAAFALSASAQEIRPEGPRPSEPATASTSGEEQQAIQLSPFQVNTSQDRGYYAANSLSGTRIATDLKDLASAVTVVTKQQLIDTAALDINDVFLYEASTEGLHQYTDFVQDRSFYNETTTLRPQSANRIRGLSTPNRALNHFGMSSRIPIDSYNIDSVEISRGPNANLFGLGEGSGTVNVNYIQPRLDGDITQVLLRGDSYGGWRAGLDVSRPIAPGKLAFRLGAIRDDKGFERKPAYEKVDRLTASVIVQPLRNTTVRAWYERYRNDYNRANTTLPRDGVNEWLQNGMPVWNPTFGTTGGYRMLNDSTYTAVAANQEGTLYPLGFLPTQTGFSARPNAYIDRGEIVRYEAARGSSAATPNANAPWRYVETSDIVRRGGGVLGYPPLILYQTPSLSDRSQYDWKSINFLAPNHGLDKADTYMVTLEQTLLAASNQRLAAQLGFYREEVDTFDHNFLSRTDGATPYVTIDVNETFIDGTPNPFFLRPYIGATEPRINFVDETNDNYRATLAYELDLRENSGWSRWLGLHRLAAYGEKRELYTASYFARERNIADYDWTSVNDLASLPLRGASYNVYSRYYVGGRVDEPGPIVDSAPDAPKSISGTYPLIWYPSGGRTPRIDQAVLDSVISGGSANLREIESLGLTWQGYFWKDRIVPTIGWREDTQKERTSRSLNSNNPATNPTSTIGPDRLHDLSYLKVFPNPAVENSGRTKTAGIVVHATPWLSVHYNKSDAFKPEPIRRDIFLNVLTNPTSEGEDYGFSISLLDNRLVAKVNRYEVVELNSRSGATSGAFAARTFRFFFDTGSGGLVPNTDPTDPGFNNQLDPWDLEQMGATWYRSMPGNLDKVDEAIAWARQNYLAPFGFTDEYIATVRSLGGGSFAEVNTVTSKGWELELAYNPTRYWTMKLTAAQQEAIDSELSGTLNKFFEDNLAKLEDIVVPETPWTIANGTAGRKWWEVSPTSNAQANPQVWYFQNILTTLKQASANAGKPRPQTREWRAALTTDYRFAGIFESGWMRDLSVGGSLRWEDKAALGYYGAAPIFNGAVVEYDVNRPIYDKARFYLDLKLGYNLRLFDSKVRCRLQLNVRNALEGGRLQPFVYNPDGNAWNYRIIDPRQFILSATFDL